MTEPPVKIPITAEDRFSRTFAQLKRDLGDVRGTLGNIAGVAGRALGAISLGTVAGLGGVGLAIKNLAADIDSLNDGVDATGASLEKFSGLESFARRNGADVRLVTDLVVKLNQALNTAKPDSPTAKALAAIGLQAEELKRQDPADALQAVSRALDGYADTGSKARVTQLLLGEDAKRFAPFLRDLAQAGELNATVTKRQADEAERFGKQLSRLQADLNDTGRAIASAVVPQLNQMFLRIAALREVYGGVFAGLLANVTSAKFAEAGEGVRFYSGEVRRLQADVERLRRGGSPFDFLNADAAEKDLAKAAKTLEFYRRVFSQNLVDDLSSDPRNDPRRGRGFVGKPTITDVNPGSSKPQTRQISEAERLLELLQKQASGYDKLSASGKLFADIEAGRIQGLTPELQKQLETEARRVDALSQATFEQGALVELQKQLNAEKEKEAGFQKLIDDKRQRDLDEALALLQDTQVGRAQRAAQQIDTLRELLNQPGVDADRASQILEAIEKIKAGLEDVGETGKTQFDKLLDAVDNFAENSINAVLDFAETGELSAGRLFKAFSRDILRELIEDPIRDTMKNAVKTIRDELGKLDGANNPIAAIFSFLKGLGGSGGGDFFGSLFSGFTGRAGGGGVNRGDLVRWQEGGREWFVPQENGTVLTQAQLRQMQGGSVYAPTTLHINGDVSAATVGLVRRMLDERDARLARSLQYGRMRAA